MSKDKQYKPSKKKIESAKEELDYLAEQKKVITTRESELRHAIADSLHHGEDGTENVLLHGYEIKIGRKLSISCTKPELSRLAEENEELYDSVTKTETKLWDTKAKEHIDELDEYVTTKQGLPTVSIKKVK